MGKTEADCDQPVSPAYSAPSWELINGGEQA